METGKLKRQRTCISCGKVCEKTDLFRVVRPKSSPVFFDETRRAPGRGAYVCSSACLEEARLTGKLNRALRTRVSEQEYIKVVKDLQDAFMRQSEKD